MKKFKIIGICVILVLIANCVGFYLYQKYEKENVEEKASTCHVYGCDCECCDDECCDGDCDCDIDDDEADWDEDNDTIDW